MLLGAHSFDGPLYGEPRKLALFRNTWGANLRRGAITHPTME
jgi:hypothetical protein